MVAEHCWATALGRSAASRNTSGTSGRINMVVCSTYAVKRRMSKVRLSVENQRRNESGSCVCGETKTRAEG